ncbi:MAG: hypothetical protein HN731_04195 [Rhodospirillaceae bacterium]|jgi:hypothetical protein|nr:hypothetical protein [Rhodospirillaceae bacterium]MBT7954364.1 hypothetical protein [Rhodospirillaceae bacterium]
MKSVAYLAVIFMAWINIAVAGDVAVVNATAFNNGNGTYRFTVTLRHADDGWKHYADNWEVLTVQGTVLGIRKLLHPHVNEQPFTRSIRSVRIPAGIKEVVIRGHDKVHKNGGKELKLKLPGR